MQEGGGGEGKGVKRELLNKLLKKFGMKNMQPSPHWD